MTAAEARTETATPTRGLPPADRDRPELARKKTRGRDADGRNISDRDWLGKLGFYVSKIENLGTLLRLPYRHIKFQNFFDT